LRQHRAHNRHHDDSNDNGDACHQQCNSPSLLRHPGTIATYTTASSIDLTSPFFQPIGTNGRTCATCHQPSQGMGISAAASLALFTSSHGADPLFSAIDGANYPTAPTGDAASHSLLLNNGLVRVAMTLPANPQFTIVATHDPYGSAITTDPFTGRPTISIYRRPLPSSNLPYLSDVMWDARASLSPLSSATGFASNLDHNLTQQLLDAITTHA